MADPASPEKRRGRLFVITAPSGAGKSTLLSALMDRMESIVFSVSYTTRLPRPGEEDGRDYFFVTRQRFKEMMDAGELAEWTKTYGHYYGTGRRELEEILATGKDVLLDLDTRGFHAVKKFFPDAVGVFVTPPSFEVLRERLEARGTEEPGELALRLDEAATVMGQMGDFDRVVINDTVEAAVDELAGIILAARGPA
jgi:guanylate kinase